MPPPPRVTTEERLLRIANMLRESYREIDALFTDLGQNDALWGPRSSTKSAMDAITAIIDLRGDD